MDYYVKMTGCTATINVGKTDELLVCLLQYIEKYNPVFDCISMQRLKSACIEKDFMWAMNELNYSVELKSYGNKKVYAIGTFIGEELGDDQKVFEILSPFMNDGYIEMMGEDGDIWRWVFENGEMHIKRPSIIWD